MAIILIIGLPRKGKTMRMTHIANCTMFDRDRIREMHNEINGLNQGGFEYSKPRHTVVSNYDIVGFKFGYTSRFSRRISPFRLGFWNRFVDVHLIAPCTDIFITEGQKYYNSRMSKYFPDWASRFYEQHGHNGLNIYIDTQRFELIDKNIRELASLIIEIISVENKNGKTIWKERHYADHKAYESGEYTEHTEVADYDVRRCYNHKSCKPMHYQGRFNDDFDCQEHEPTEDTPQGWTRFFEINNDNEFQREFYNEKKGVA